MITGYNIQNFDMPYLLDRANHLKIKEFCFLGRIKDCRSVIRTSMIQSKQMGKRENKIINMEGRVQFDLLQVCGFPLLLCPRSTTKSRHGEIKYVLELG